MSNAIPAMQMSLKQASHPPNVTFFSNKCDQMLFHTR
jgi:hypothetical protein